MARLKILPPRLQSATLQRVPQAMAHRFTDPTRAGTTERGYGWEWQKLRLVILARDKHQCQECKRQARLTAATHVDHIVNKASGGTDDPSNLQSLCAPCHKVKSQAEAREAGGDPGGVCG